MYRQIEIEQELLLGQSIKPGVIIETNLWKISIYNSSELAASNGEKDKNHAQVKKHLKALSKNHLWNSWMLSRDFH